MFAQGRVSEAAEGKESISFRISIKTEKFKKNQLVFIIYLFIYYLFRYYISIKYMFPNFKKSFLPFVSKFSLEKKG